MNLHLGTICLKSMSEQRSLTPLWDNEGDKRENFIAELPDQIFSARRSTFFLPRGKFALYSRSPPLSLTYSFSAHFLVELQTRNGGRAAQTIFARTFEREALLNWQFDTLLACSQKETLCSETWSWMQQFRDVHCNWHCKTYKQHLFLQQKGTVTTAWRGASYLLPLSHSQLENCSLIYERFSPISERELLRRWR